MRSMRLRFLLPLLAAPMMVQAQAPLVYMQFGSFETESEAQERLEQVAKDHVGILGSIPLGVHEVAVGENLNVYRTQAGPIESRNTAQFMCGQLASNGDACYIVETAIQRVQPAAPVAQATPAPVPPRLPVAPKVEEEVVALREEVVEPASRGKGLKPLPSRARAAVDALREAAKDMPVEPAAPELSARRPAPPTLQQPRVERDVRNMQTLAQLNNNMPVREKVRIQNTRVERIEPSSEMEAALAEAAGTVPNSQRAVPSNFEHEEDGSFWDAINPFGSSSDEAPQPAVRAPEVAERIEVAKQETVPRIERRVNTEMSEEIRRLSRSNLAEHEQPVVQQPVIQELEVQQEVAEAPASTPLAIPSLEEARRNLPRASIDDIISNRVATEPKQAVDSGLPLLAPPLPKKTVRQQQMQQPHAAPAVSHIPVVQTRALPPAHIPSIAPPPSTTVTAVMPDGAAVQVEEAQRVPLTDMAQEAMMVEEELRRPVVAYAGPSGLTADAMPSQSRLNKTQWAQLNYFDTPQQALGFWEGFRRTHPDFPVVRVRVTSPYSALLNSKKRYSLRVGPFGNGRFVEALCDSDPVDDDDLECRSMGDLGVSANHKLDSKETAATYRPGRYGLAARGIDALSGFWVQLGTYNSMGKAEQGWEDMKREYGSVLSSMQAQVSTPSLGSQARAVYRLRTGPFVNQKAAEELCGRLQEEQAQCLVVAERQS